LIEKPGDPDSKSGKIYSNRHLRILMMYAMIQRSSLKLPKKKQKMASNSASFLFLMSIISDSWIGQSYPKMAVSGF